MQKLFIALAFCSTGYVALGFFAVEFVGGTGTQKSLALGLTVCFAASCLIATMSTVSAACLSWIAAAIYALLSWRTDAAWVFHGNLERFAFWTPLFLTIAAFSRPRRTSIQP